VLEVKGYGFSDFTILRASVASIFKGAATLHRATLNRATVNQSIYLANCAGSF